MAKEIGCEREGVGVGWSGEGGRHTSGDAKPSWEPGKGAE